MDIEIRNPQPNDQEFTYYWELFAKDVTDRENFKMGHLEQLRILCSLYIEYHELCKDIKIEGYTHETEGGRNGPQTKPNLKVAVRDRILAEIRQYSKLLGLILKEDKSSKDDEKKKVDEWA